MDSFPPKYLGYLKAGLSRGIIESSLTSDGFTRNEILTFWQNAAQRAIEKITHCVDITATDAWKEIQPYQKFQNYKIIDPATPKLPGHTRFVCLSDTHGLHDSLSIPMGDVLIHAGDFTDTGDRDQVIDFNRFLGEQPHAYKIVIAGNHECSFDKEYYMNNWMRYGHEKQHDVEEVRTLLTNGLYLEDEMVTINGISIYGTPWQPNFCNWAFNLPRGEALRLKWKAIPENLDILVTHTPPLGRGDSLASGMRVGDIDLLDHVQNRIKPKYHIFGHVHEGYGTSSDGGTTYINASNCTHEYQATNQPIVFDFPTPSSPLPTDKDYENLCAKRRKLSELVVVDETPQDTPLASSLKDMRIEGTETDQMFEKKLLERSPGTYSSLDRAMRYIFHGPFRDPIYARRRARFRIVDNEPDYTTTGDQALNARPRITRRFTSGILELEENACCLPNNHFTQTMSTSTKITSTHRRRLLKRDGVAVLPTLDENERDTTPLSNSSAPLDCCSRGSRTDETTSSIVSDFNMDEIIQSHCSTIIRTSSETSTLLPASTTTETNGCDTQNGESLTIQTSSNSVMEKYHTSTVDSKETCLLCKFDVSGHVHYPSSDQTIQVKSTIEMSTQGSLSTISPADQLASNCPTLDPTPCLLCKYGVSGHIHTPIAPLSTSHKETTKCPLSSSEEHQVSNEDHVEGNQQNKRVSHEQNQEIDEEGGSSESKDQLFIRATEDRASSWF